MWPSKVRDSSKCNALTAPSLTRALDSFTSITREPSTTDGDPVLPNITIPSNATAVTITQYGMVNASLPGQQNPSQLGQIQLATFPNPGGLQSMGSNLLQSTLSSGDPVLGNPGGAEGLGTLQQGYLENSNVDVVTEFVQMVLAQRAYESNTKVIKAADDMYSQINNMTR